MKAEWENVPRSAGTRVARGYDGPGCPVFLERVSVTPGQQIQKRWGHPPTCKDSFDRYRANTVQVITCIKWNLKSSSSLMLQTTPRSVAKRNEER